MEQNYCSPYATCVHNQCQCKPGFRGKMIFIGGGRGVVDKVCERKRSVCGLQPVCNLCA